MTTIGVDQKILGSDIAASLVGAAMISVLVLPLFALRLRAGAGGTEPRADDARESEAW